MTEKYLFNWLTCTGQRFLHVHDGQKKGPRLDESLSPAVVLTIFLQQFLLPCRMDLFRHEDEDVLQSSTLQSTSIPPFLEPSLPNVKMSDVYIYAQAHDMD